MVTSRAMYSPCMSSGTGAISLVFGATAAAPAWGGMWHLAENATKQATQSEASEETAQSETVQQAINELDHTCE